MPEELFEELVRELARHHFTGRFSPYLMNEPLYDRRLPDLVALARRHLGTNTIAINSNGDYLGNETGLIEQLRDAGLDLLLLNFYTHRQRAEVLFERLSGLNGVVAHRQGVRINSFSRDGRLHVRVKPFGDIPQTFWNRGGNAALVTRSESTRHPLPCNLLFEQGYMLSDGRAVLCCSDWGQEVVLGTFPKQSLPEIFDSDEALRYRSAHLEGDVSDLKLCQVCDRIDQYIRPSSAENR